MQSSNLPSVATNVAPEDGQRPRKRPAAKSLLRRMGGGPRHPNIASSSDDKIKADTVDKDLSKAGIKSKTKTPPRKTKSPSETSKKTKKSESGKSTKKTVATNKRPRQGGERKGPTAPIWVGAPTEDLDGGWPEGWIKKIFERKSGKTKGGTDRYWFSPDQNYKLRSMIEVKKFMKALEQTNGDEVAAKKLMASIVL